MLMYFVNYCWFLVALLVCLNIVLEIFNYFSNSKAYKQKALVKIKNMKSKFYKQENL